MDTSKEYIKMCEKAEEIQKSLKRRHNGSLVFHPKHGIRLMYWSKHHGSPPPHYFNKPAVWLPRQDQLQEMVTEQTTSTCYLIEKFSFFVYDNWGDIWNLLPQHPSMEQLWLAFVMAERFGKYWSGKEWLTKK